MKNLRYLAKGKRGVVYTTTYRNKKVAIKKKNPDSEAIGRIQHEANMLKLLNKANIGPKFISHKENELIYVFVEGEFIIDFIEKNSKTNILKVLNDIFKQMFTLDKLGLNKEEMHHPLKHILVHKNKPVMIDFERTHYTIKPKNVTQFCQFMMSTKKLLDSKNIKINKKEIMSLAQTYKNKRTLENFNNILRLLNNKSI
jgi:putative serine/threonine protein kinase